MNRLFLRALSLVIPYLLTTQIVCALSGGEFSDSTSSSYPSRPVSDTPSSDEDAHATPPTVAEDLLLPRLEELIDDSSPSGLDLQKVRERRADAGRKSHGSDISVIITLHIELKRAIVQDEEHYQESLRKEHDCQTRLHRVQNGGLLTRLFCCVLCDNKEQLERELAVLKRASLLDQGRVEAKRKALSGQRAKIIAAIPSCNIDAL